MAEQFTVGRVDRIADILYGVATGGGTTGYGPLARRIRTRPDFLSQPRRLATRTPALLRLREFLDSTIKI